MGIKSNESKASYYNFFGATGDGAETLGPSGPSITSSGGTQILDPAGRVTYHVFTNDNAPPTSAAPFTVSAPLNVSYLVVGGGGGGGYNSGGGGGAGAMRSNHPDMPAPLRGSAYPVAPGTTYNIKVGGGAAAGTSQERVGQQSELGSSNPAPITCDPGGCGGKTETNGQSSPGNGSGGAGGNDFAPQSTTGGEGGTYGNDGGRQIGPAPGSTGGGGGGGAGESGYSTGNVPSPLQPKRGNGGAGLQIPSLPAPIISPGIPSPEKSAFETAVGPTGWFAGGGGGHVDFADGPSPTNGGDGGGGNGQNPEAATGDSNGIYGTGGGGGGGNPQGMAGGSGIIVLYFDWDA